MLKTCSYIKKNNILNFLCLINFLTDCRSRRFIFLINPLLIVNKFANQPVVQHDGSLLLKPLTIVSFLAEFGFDLALCSCLARLGDGVFNVSLLPIFLL